LLGLTARIEASDALFRLTVAGFGAASVALTWLIGRRLFDPKVGLAAAAGVALTPVMLAASSAVWPDIPGTALGLAAIAVLLFASEGDRVRWWALLAGPLVVLSTLFRFGAPLPIGVAALGLAAWRWRAVRTSPGVVGVLAVLTAAVVVTILTVPAVLGTDLSVIEATRRLQAANDFPIYQGFVDYAQQFDLLIVTPAGVLLILGLLWGAAAVRTPDSAHRPAYLLTALVGLVTAVALALALHGETRYLTPAYPWLWLAAGFGLVEGFRRVEAPFRNLLTAVLAGALVLGAVADGDVEMTKLMDRFWPLRAAAREIDDVTEDGQCGILTGYVPQVAWYSHCITTSIADAAVRLTYPGFPADAERFLFLVEEGKRQPEGDLLAAYLEATPEVVVTVGEQSDGPLGYVEVRRVPAAP
jgi:hypothetical protein